MKVSRRVLERQQRRSILLEAAARIFGRKPFDEATMQEVAAEAEIGMQGLYEHFPSKQELYEQVMESRAEVFRTRAEEALAGISRPLEQIRALAEVYTRQFREQPMLLPMFIRDRVHHDWGFQSRFGERIRRIYEEESLRLRGFLEAAIAQEQLRPLDPGFLTQLCLGALEASLHYSHRHPEEAVGTCVDRAMDCLICGVGVQS
ncbi:TetR/AcrR family transcriptional regulator [Holophaga foetida]|uniref:TetR/AcrR family transcriptional regulator n=1 Tax=Holophaga foetida TaxID=35839 RepID=UPI00024725EE|nr:TetR/AcrR family transcriptional regulator [Holophaga foetida]